MGQGHFSVVQVAWTPSSLTWNVSWEWSHTAPLTNLSNFFTIHIIKNGFPIPNLNLHSFSLKLLLLVLPLLGLLKSQSSSFLQTAFKY